MDTNVKTSINRNLKYKAHRRRYWTTNYELKVVLEHKVYLETYYIYQPWSVEVDETLANIKTIIANSLMDIN